MENVLRMMQPCSAMVTDLHTRLFSNKNMYASVARAAQAQAQVYKHNSHMLGLAVSNKMAVARDRAQPYPILKIPSSYVAMHCWDQWAARHRGRRLAGGSLPLAPSSLLPCSR